MLWCVVALLRKWQPSDEAFPPFHHFLGDTFYASLTCSCASSRKMLEVEWSEWERERYFG